MNAPLSPLEGIIVAFFGDEPWEPAEEELFKWLLFTYYEKGSGIKDLDRAQFEQFKEKLNQLVEVVYQWHKQEQKPDSR